MPAIIAWLLSGLATLFRSNIGQWAAMVLLFFGLELATSTIAVEPLVAYVQGAFTGMPAAMVAWLGYLNMDRYVSIILSAFTTSIAAKAFFRRRAA